MFWDGDQYLLVKKYRLFLQYFCINTKEIFLNYLPKSNEIKIYKPSICQIFLAGLIPGTKVTRTSFQSSLPINKIITIIINKAMKEPNKFFVTSSLSVLWTLACPIW